ncbi:GIY-YIG nuclease family protein [Infirmifilum sp.]|uniref:GIY-YIG nuclease family protein n=1 Tax=Infirmifilum sp. TaxID=2856575 RepID=UPI003D0CEA13
MYDRFKEVYINMHETLKGIYALIIKVQEPIHFMFKRENVCLKPGIYVYIGSARGPGGVKARVDRHRKPQKKIRWHIDNVTSSPHARVLGVVFASSPGPECVLTPILEDLGFTHPIKGFGSSDCKLGCYSHFLRCNSEITKCYDDVREAFKQSFLNDIRIVHFES